MIIEKINEYNKKMLDIFIKRIPSIKEIEDDILENMFIIRNETNILGIISYEKYIDKGLIRYFIFQKDVEFNNLELLFEEMRKKAIEDDIKLLITVIDDTELVAFFEKLRFKKIDINTLYLYETPVVDTINSNAICMIHKKEEV